MKWSSQGHEFDAAGRRFCDPNTEYLVWGAGENGQNLLHQYGSEINIVGIVSSEGHPPSLREVSVHYYTQQDVLPVSDGKIIIVAIRTYDSWLAVRGWLLRYGKKEWVDFFHYIDFMEIFEIYRNDRAILMRTNIVVNDHCTLRCRDCTLGMAFYTKHPQLRLEDIEKNIETVFSSVDYVIDLQLVGGEPLLCRELGDVIRYIGERHPKCYERLMILTNGTIIPDDGLIDACKEFNVWFQISDYSRSSGFTGRQRLDELTQLLSENALGFEVLDMAEWYDFKGNRGAAENASPEAMSEFMNICVCRTTVFRDGMVFPCHPSASRTWGCQSNAPFHADGLPVSEIKSRKELIELDLGYWVDDALEGCRWCYSETPLKQRIIPAARQVGAKE